MEEPHRLLVPLLAPSTPNHHNYKNLKPFSWIIFRLVLVVLVGIISIWANHEASKGFAISIVNDSNDTLAGKRFSLFYISNDEATRIIFKTSKLVENFLYPNDTYPKKQVNHVVLKLAGRNLTTSVSVEGGKEDEFVIHVSPSIMEEKDFSHAMYSAVQHGMARIWLFDGNGKAPKKLINGIVEYLISHLDGGSVNASRPAKAEQLNPATACLKFDHREEVAEFLHYGERHQPGFIRRLNQAMKELWHQHLVYDAFGVLAQPMCLT